MKFFLSNHKELIFSVILSILFFLLFSVLGTINSSNSILIITFGVLFWYSLETRQLKIVTQEQSSPILFLYFNENEDYLYLSNFGRTIATNIFLTPVICNNDKIEFNLLEPIYYINPGERQKIKTTISNISGTRTFNPNSQVQSIINLMRKNGNDKIIITIIYDSVQKNREKINFFLNISKHLVDEKDSMRKCEIYRKY